MVMPLQLPEPPNQVTDLISGKLQYVGEQAGTGPSALGGSAPAELTLTDPHEVYTLALNELVGQDGRSGGATCSATKARWSPRR